MTRTTAPDVEQSVASCRVIFSVIALISLIVDPTTAIYSWWPSVSGGSAAIGPRVFLVLGAHLGYSLVVYYFLVHRSVAPAWLKAVTTWNDILFAAVIALCTNGASSPFYAFFIFALLAAAFQRGLPHTLIVTAIGVVVYVAMIGISPPENTTFYITRPAYLAIIGYLVGYLGQRRLEL